MDEGEEGGAKEGSSIWFFLFLGHCYGLIGAGEGIRESSDGEAKRKRKKTDEE